MILAGDIGGTHTRLALFDHSSGRLRMVVQNIYPSREHKGLDEILGLFLSNRNITPTTACFGIAGPVVQGRANVSNLAWTVDAIALAKLLGIETVWLINDLVAHASGITALAQEDFVVLNAGSAVPGNAALVSAGTGLGEAGLFWDGVRHQPFASEGGHSDFAPRNELEIALHRYLLGKFGRVSYERILSGPGVVNIYDFLRDSGAEQEPDWLKQELLQAVDPSALISEHALQQKAPICTRTLEIFAAVYGAEAGNVALRFLATEGIYLSGGIVRRILPRLNTPTFLEAFLDKGRMRKLLENVPVKAITNDTIGLIGAAQFAFSRQKLGSGQTAPANTASA